MWQLLLRVQSAGKCFCIWENNSDIYAKTPKDTEEKEETQSSQNVEREFINLGNSVSEVSCL